MNFPNILFLADTSHHTKAVTDHIKAITTGNSFNWHVLNPLVCKTLDKLDLSMFDAIGLHYSIKPYNYYYLPKLLQKKIASYEGTKFLFLQDEYQQVNRVQSYLYTMGFDLLFTLVDDSIMEKAYPDPRLSKLRKVNVLTGYVQDEMKHIDSLPISERTIDVSYRGRRCHYWLGSLANEKVMIAREFVSRTQHTELNLDISTEEHDRVYGEAWLRLLTSSKTVLGTESGASIWDFDETVISKTNQFLKRHRDAGFDLVYEHVLKPYDGKILYNAISPRVFEAAAARTAMIMFPGYYSGVCQPDIHYIALEKDFSNLNDVIKKIQAPEYLQGIADRAYVDLIESDLYSQHRLSELVERELLIQLNTSVKRDSIHDITVLIENKRNQYRHLNKIRCLSTEVYFIVCNFINLLSDPKYTFWGKITSLTNGFKRYIAYLLPRLRKIID